jgi:hypothetical protein
MTDGYLSFNSQVWPLQSSATPILELADPVLFQMATFFEQLLNTNLLPRFHDECVACGLTHSNLDNFVDNVGVAQTITFPLNSSILRVNDFKFPLLNIYPKEEEYINFTLTNIASTRTFHIQWILPPLSAFQYNRLYPFLSYTSKILHAYGVQGYDPKTNPTGPSFWKRANLSFGSWDTAEYSELEGFLNRGSNNTDLPAIFPALEIQLTFTERNQLPVPENFIPFTGISLLQENLVDGYNPANPISNFVDGYIFPDITLTNCTPNSGSINGGKMVIIEGTGFEPEKILTASQLVICGSVVRQVIVKSPTVLMAFTNPGISVGIGSIVLTDLQGNNYILSNGYTYT